MTCVGLWTRVTTWLTCLPKHLLPISHSNILKTREREREILFLAAIHHFVEFLLSSLRSFCFFLSSTETMNHSSVSLRAVRRPYGKCSSQRGVGRAVIITLHALCALSSFSMNDNCDGCCSSNRWVKTFP